MRSNLHAGSQQHINYRVTNCDVKTTTEVIKCNWQDNHEQKLCKNLGV